MIDSFGLFLLSVVGISLSGVMLPGPLTAATITRGYNNPNAGLFIGLGHSIIELPIMALIYFGFADYLAAPEVKRIVGALGGLMLLIMGSIILLRLGRKIKESVDLPYTPLVTGMIMTVVNPYIFLWWATIGVALIASAVQFGILGLTAFAVVHWLCDISWDQIVTVTVFKTRHLWTTKVQRIIFGSCAGILIGFGIYFCVSVFI